MEFSFSTPDIAACINSCVKLCPVYSEYVQHRYTLNTLIREGGVRRVVGVSSTKFTHSFD